MENPVVATVLADTVPAASADRAVRVEDFPSLRPRAVDDPQRLHGRVMKALDHYFLTRGSTYLSGQRDALSDIVSAVLDDGQTGMFAIPLVPGGGKSTLLRALLTVFAEVFRGMSDPIAQWLGGVVVVVEKTAEGDELEELCNRGLEPGEPAVARLISSTNDYNLQQGKCLTGTAATYADCLRKDCPSAAVCLLLNAMMHLAETPVLILLHARLAQHLPDLTPFTSWCEADGTEHRRTLILIDECPALVREEVVSTLTINAAENDLLAQRDSRLWEMRYLKRVVQGSWNHAIRIPFDRLNGQLSREKRDAAIITPEELSDVGMTGSALREAQDWLTKYKAPSFSPAVRMTEALLQETGTFFHFGKNLEVVVPSLQTIRSDGPLRSFIFSGTAGLLPELALNPDIDLLPTELPESYERLTIHVQRDGVIGMTRTGLQRSGAVQAVALWLQRLLPEAAQKHGRVLLVTYKFLSQRLLELLGEECRNLVYTVTMPDGNGPCLPYFGGVAGSNEFRDATAVICLGMPRVEPRVYLSRALAIDPDGAHMEELSCAIEALERQPCVLDMQDHYLAHDLVQMAFRSRLRHHGDTTPVELWLTQPPGPVLKLLRDYFPDCAVDECPTLPEDCHLAVSTARQRKGSPANTALLLNALLAVPEGEEITPAQLREQTGLTQNQYKETIRAPSVKELFRTEFITFGSGKNQKIRRAPTTKVA